MKQNVGGIDKVVRLIAGLALLSMLFLVEGSAKWFGLIGLVPLGTALIGWCPLYTLLGLSTCPAKTGPGHA
jgi:hypothetical protein